MFVQRFIIRQPYFTPVRAEVTISFEKLTSHPNLKEKLCYLEKLLNSKTVQLVMIKVDDYVTREFLNINVRPIEQHFLFAF